MSRLNQYLEVVNNDSFGIGDQPCDDFTPEEGHFSLGEKIPCQKCGGEIAYCINCKKEHHKEGWQSCHSRQDQRADEELMRAKRDEGMINAAAQSGDIGYKNPFDNKGNY